jgi:hypothetical protein
MSTLVCAGDRAYHIQGICTYMYTCIHTHSGTHLHTCMHSGNKIKQQPNNDSHKIRLCTHVLRTCSGTEDNDAAGITVRTKCGGSCPTNIRCESWPSLSTIAFFSGSSLTYTSSMCACAFCLSYVHTGVTQEIIARVVCLYVYIYIYTHTHTHTHSSYIYMYICMYTYIYIYIYIYI